MRVCIVTTGQIGSNPRVMKEARALHDAGCVISVIATRLPGRIEVADLEALPWRLDLVDFRPRRRWRRLRVEQLLSRGLERLTKRPRHADLGLSVFTRGLELAALRTPADLYIAHYPPALPAAAAAACRFGARYAYDAEDFHLGDWPAAPGYDSERYFVRSVEGRYLPDCSFVSASSPMIADALVETYRISRPQTVLNVFPISQAPKEPAPRGTVVPGPCLYWFSQTIGQDRGLECAVEAIGRARTQPHLVLRGLLAPGFGERLARLADEAGATGRVHIISPAAPDDMERLAANYDLGLASETMVSRNRSICLTNKLFSFLLAGLPPLLSGTPAQLRFAEEAGLVDLVYPVGDASALAMLLDRYLCDPPLLAATRAKVWRLGRERYNWDIEKIKLIDEVRNVPRSPSG